MTNTVTITQVANPTDLYQHYADNHSPQPCHLAIDLEDGEMSCGYNSEPDPRSMPASVWHGRTLWLEIPALTADAANQLMAEVLPLAQRVYDGSSIEWDGNNHVGQLNDDAYAALDEIKQIIDTYQDEDYCVTGQDAGEWYAEGDDPTQEWGITAQTTDEELSAIAARAEEELIAQAGHTVVVSGSEQYVHELREQLRRSLRDELDDVTDERARLTQRRDELIRQIRAWGADSDRAIGALAGLSHTAVQKIAAQDE